MNKTLTINISGIIFHIEEDAFASLSQYLSEIKKCFQNVESGAEIMGDIEARIAELLKERTSPSKQVILMSDVDLVKSTMGKPEDFSSGQEDESGKQEKTFHHAEEKIRRRLFRNPDDKALGGVCSGLAAYFDIDTVWVRLIMFLLIFFGGLSLWVYIILWIVMPEAKTTADKLSMRGEKANINSIFRSVKEEAEDVKNRFSSRNYSDRVVTNFSSALITIFNVLGRVIGLFMLLIGGALFLVYLASLLGISILEADAELSKWKDVIFGSQFHYNLGVLGFILVAGIPILMLIYGGVKLLFRIRYNNRWLNLSLGLAWVIGLVIAMYVTIITVKEFNQSSTLKETIELHGKSDTLVVKLNPSKGLIKSMNFDNIDELDISMGKKRGSYFFGDSGKKISIIGSAGLDVLGADSDSTSIVILRSARGYTKKEANERARTIRYSYQSHKNELNFDEVFFSPGESKFRMQELAIKLKLPVGKVVYFDKSLKHFLNEADNTSNIWAGKMVSHYWKMTSRGLQCMDCVNSDFEDMSDSRGSIELHSKKGTLKINEDGIHISSSDGSVNIGKDGVKIDKEE